MEGDIAQLLLVAEEIAEGVLALRSTLGALLMVVCWFVGWHVGGVIWSPLSTIRKKP